MELDITSTSPEGTILIVDDDNVGRVLLAKSLPHYTVKTARDGYEALKEIEHAKPDLILLDVNMPGMDGFEVCQTLKESSQTASIPIIFITGLSQFKDIAKGFQLGAVDYITKPFEINEVRARVKTHLALTKAKESLRRKNTELKKIIEQQAINSNLARKVLNLINRIPSRYIELGNGQTLFINSFSQPCYAEGGDHFLVRTLPKSSESPSRTIISLKDQSGHSVNCILRSIITDLVHNSILHQHSGSSLEDSMSELNNKIASSDLFAEDDFLTAMTVELDHSTLNLQFSSAGHPSFILIRNGIPQSLPKKNALGTNLPIGFVESISYTADRVQLEEGDKIILFTDGLTDMPLDQTGTSISNDLLVSLTRESINECERLTVSVIMSTLIEKIRLLSTTTTPDQKHFNDDITVLGIELEKDPCKNEISLTNITDIDSAISQCIGQIMQHCSDNNAEVDETHFELVVSEILLNAWKHGNKTDPSKTISICWWIANDLNIEITDQGQGFSLTTQNDPSQQKNLTKSSGRGIFLAKKFSDSIRWFDGGRRAIISFRIAHHNWGETLDKPSNDIILWTANNIVQMYGKTNHET